jgi:hypothetical protein
VSSLPGKFRHIARHTDRPCRFSSDEEVKALQIINIALKQSPQSYTLLHVQCDFLRTKGRLDWALQLAKEAVNCAPSEFVTWAKLTEVYVEMGEYENVRPELSSGTLALSAGLTVALLALDRPCSRSTRAQCSRTTSATYTGCRRRHGRTRRSGPSSPSPTFSTRRARSTTRCVGRRSYGVSRELTPSGLIRTGRPTSHCSACQRLLYEAPLARRTPC